MDRFSECSGSNETTTLGENNELITRTWEIVCSCPRVGARLWATLADVCRAKSKVGRKSVFGVLACVSGPFRSSEMHGSTIGASLSGTTTPNAPASELSGPS